MTQNGRHRRSFVRKARWRKGLEPLVTIGRIVFIPQSNQGRDTLSRSMGKSEALQP